MVILSGQSLIFRTGKLRRSRIRNEAAARYAHLAMDSPGALETFSRSESMHCGPTKRILAFALQHLGAGYPAGKEKDHVERGNEPLGRRIHEGAFAAGSRLLVESSARAAIHAAKSSRPWGPVSGSNGESL